MKTEKIIPTIFTPKKRFYTHKIIKKHIALKHFLILIHKSTPFTTTTKYIYKNKLLVMKFTALTEHLKDGILLAEKSTGKKAALPVLSSILCTAEKGKITLTSTNLETAVEVWVGGKVEREGKIAVPARILSSYMSLVNGEQVTFLSKGAHVEVASQKGRTLIRGHATDDFPLVPRQEEMGAFVIAAPSLRNALNRVAFAAAVSDIKPEIASMYFSIAPSVVTIAATDSFRLAEQKIEGVFGENGVSHTFLLPARGAQELARLLEKEEQDISVSIGKGQIVVLSKRFRFVSRLTEGQYPDYQRIVPVSFGTEALAQKNGITDVLRVAGLFVGKLHDLTFSVDPKNQWFQARTANTDVGENTAQVAAQISGDPLQISFNYRYIMDGLQQLDGEVLFCFTSASGPLMMRAKDDQSYFYIVMPMKV